MRWLQLWQQPLQHQKQRKNNKNRQQQLQRLQPLAHQHSKYRSANPRIVERNKMDLETEREGETQAQEHQHPGGDAGVDR